MDTATRHAIDLMLGHSLTWSPIDRSKIVVILRAYPDAITMVLEKRRLWKEWVTVTQREWQTKVSRRPSKAAHHDSIEIRERYVRG